MSRIAPRTWFGLPLLFLGILCTVPATAFTKSSRVASLPEPPRLYVDTTYVPSSGRTIAVPAGGDLQLAFNTAKPGDVIMLKAGATFTGPFTLPNKPGSGWITVRTSVPDSSLPTPGTRVDPSYAKVMPKLVAASGSVITTAPGAHHYRFIGIEIQPMTGVFLHNLVQLGMTETSVEKLPHHIIFDRCYLHGDPEKGARRGIAMNSRDTAVIDSYLSDFKEVGADSQAIASWNGPGPFKIENNYLEGAGENVMFGGADPTIPNLVPSDIEIRRNHFFKPLSWKLGSPAFEGMPWAVKNLFELKNARRVLVDGNIFERNWVHAQNGFSILFTVRNQDGGASWATVEDVTFTNNVVCHAASAINILGRDTTWPSGSRQTRQILIKNNLFNDIGGSEWGGRGILFQILNGTAHIVIEHNTALHTGSIIMAEGEAHTGFAYQNNIAQQNSYGIIGTGTAPGNQTLLTYFPGARVIKNVIVGGTAAFYPPGNFFPPSLDDVGFMDRVHGDYRLANSSLYRHDAGVDLNVLLKALGVGTALKTLC